MPETKSKAERRIDRIKALSLREIETENNLKLLKETAKEAREEHARCKAELRKAIAEDLPLLEQEPAQ